MTLARQHVIPWFVLALSLACRAKEAEFYAKVFPCDLNAVADSCGTTSDGKPMVCYPGHLLSGQDFCAPACGATQAIEDSKFACVVSGKDSAALLQRCRPNQGRTDPAHACPSGLECYRTDLIEDDGLCLMMHVCTENADCQQSGRVCAGTIIRDLTSPSSTFHIATDSLMCIQNKCTSQGSSCPPEEGCLFDAYDGGSALADICVPKCDSRPCPPNFACARDDWAPGAPALCIPGVPGIRCHANQDCMVGECVDTGSGIKVCALTLPCRPFDYCAQLSGTMDVFVCAEGIPGRPLCMTTRSFGGGNCRDTSECPVNTGQQCLSYSPGAAAPRHGDCRLPCDENGRCAPRGGIPFLCVGENREGGCIASGFGFPCKDDSECYGNLACTPLGPDPRSRSNYSPKLCSIPCVTDADCDANPLTQKVGFCQQETGFCRLAGETQAPCSRDTHCRSRRCSAEVGCLQ